jgi:hypothetical protein
MATNKPFPKSVLHARQSSETRRSGESKDLKGILLSNPGKILRKRKLYS